MKKITPLVRYNLSGRQLHANCIRVAASRMQIFVDFIHVAATRVQYACDLLPLRYKLCATSASHMQILHALAASCMQSRQFFASTLREQLFELNDDAIKKSENVHIRHM